MVFISSKHPVVRLACAAVLSTMLAGCGGGDRGDGGQLSAQGRSSHDGGRANAQTISVPNGLIQASGQTWAALPPAFAAPGSYTPSSYSGTPYYVDPGPAGNNTNPGTQAQPWRDLSRAQQQVYGDGDAIFLKCGGVWRESLTLSGTGRPNYKNLLVGAYGSDCTDGNRPIIRASKWVSDQGWTPVSTGSPVLKLSITGPVGRLFKDGQPLMKARYPNPQTNGSRFVNADVTTTLTGSETSAEKAAKQKHGFKVRAAELAYLQDKDLVGATVYVRTLPYIVETAQVQSFNTATGEITFVQDLAFAVEKNAGYILEGKQWMIDTDGEWWFDGGNPGYLYYRAPGGSTAGLEASYINRGLDIYNVPGVKVERIRFEQQEEAGLNANTASGLVVNDIESVHSWGHGLFVLNAPGASVTNSRVDAAGGFGIVAWGGSHGATISGNFVTRSGMNRVGAVAGDKAQKTGGIRLQGSDNGHVENNYVYDVANGGIAFDNRTGVVIANNTVLQPCRLLTDCGGIYTSDGSAIVPGSAIRGVVHHNIVAGAQSNLDGAFIYGVNNTVAGTNQAVGIYLDDHSSWANAHDNIVSGTEVGIYIHNGANNVIQSNTVRAATYASLLVNFDEPSGTPDPIRNNLITGNTFFSQRRVDTGKFSGSAITGIDGEHTYAQVWTHRDGATAFFVDNGAGARNRSENNVNYTLSKVESPTVWRLAASGKLEQASGAVWALRTGSQLSTLGLNQWLTLNQATATTKDTETSPVSFKPFTYTAGASLISNGDFDPVGGGWASNGGEFQYTAGAACGGAAKCARAKATADWNVLASSPFTVSAQGLYLARYTVAAGVDGGGHNAQIRLNADPWTAQAQSVPSDIWGSNEVRRIEHFFKATASNSNVVLSLRPSDNTSNTFGKNLYFSQAALGPVTVDAQALPPLSTLGLNVVNASAAAQTFACTALGFQSSDCGLVVDELNQPVSFPVSVSARSAKQLYVRNAAWVQ